MKKKEIKLEQATVAYDRFTKSENLKVELVEWPHSTKDKVLAEVFLPRAILSKSWEELMTVIRFRFRRDHGYILPKHCSFIPGNTR